MDIFGTKGGKGNAESERWGGRVQGKPIEKLQIKGCMNIWGWQV